MERAARLFQNKKVSGELIGQEDIARAAWPVAVGKIVAAHTGRVRLVRDKLVVEVEDAIWQRQLFSLSRQILRRMAQVTGTNAVADIEFKIGIPRIEPQRAAQRVSSPLFSEHPSDHSDDAESISDPVLKRVYRLSRKKATA